MVKENGIGFYHNIVNISSEWMLLLLEKELRNQNIHDIKSIIERLETYYANLLTKLYDCISMYGDSLFENAKDIVKEIYNAEVEIVVPTLIEMLNILDTGKHEACTVFALILNKGKSNKEVIRFLNEALKNNTAPKYYLENLIKKLAA